MPIKVKTLESKLQGKFGFSPAPNRAKDHRWYELKIPGIPTIATKISHGRNELSKNLVGKIARQLRIKNSYLVGMINCTHSLKEYKKKVKEEPFPPLEVKF